MDTTLCAFYRTARAGAVRLSDDGGPFGFDITVALLADDLVTGYDCDALVETGCHLGDTTDYLARRYPELPVYSCDIDPSYAAFTRRRVAKHRNARVEPVDSAALVNSAAAIHHRPLFFLDAHWGPDWPLARELEAIAAGIVLIHDFDIGHPRFSYDAYGDLVCGPNMLAAMSRPPERYFVPDPEADWPLPCLQTRRRAGVGILAVGLDSGPLDTHPHLITRHLEMAVTR
ncbi:hypothetical protein OG339_45620 [Streptosporangium sp. NBC_01495]|uniref:hypothetical protein n=1 Tax=Streptosporangium sp. NBC_01495 TaxID=2903899 RepID=UPI002E35CAA4|nr:hypothetical protein [Streptosporangium sp. NBC_01495]